MSKYEHFQSYQLLLMTYQIQIQLVLSISLLKRVCGISHPLKLFKKGHIFGVAFGRILSLLPTELT